MPTLHAILAASDYRGDLRPAIRPLAGAEADARSMAALLAGSPIVGGELGGLTLLLGPQASTQGLREAIARGVAATTATGDTLLVFFAGWPSGSQGSNTPTPPRQTYVTEGPTGTAPPGGDPGSPTNGD